MDSENCVFSSNNSSSPSWLTFVNVSAATYTQHLVSFLAYVQSTRTIILAHRQATRPPPRLGQSNPAQTPDDKICITSSSVQPKAHRKMKYELALTSINYNQLTATISIIFSMLLMNLGFASFKQYFHKFHCT